MTWPFGRLEQVALQAKGSIVSRPFGSNIGSRFFVDEGVPVIRGNNLSFGQRRFFDAGFVYITEDKALAFRNCEAVEGDLVFTAAGTIGQVGIIPKNARYQRYIISNKQLRVRCDTTKVDPMFMFLWFSTEEMRRHITNKNTGSSIPLINLGILRGLPVPIPPIETQRRIVSRISAYDDLIENNQRRITLLEEAARRLYREWFVALRFPGYEHVKVVDGIPQGWERVALADAVEINPRTRADDDDTHPFVPMQALSESSMVIAEYEMRAPTAGAKFRNGDTLLARITPCLENGKTGFVQFLASDMDMASGSTEFIVMRSRHVSPYWVYCLARDESFRDHAIRSMVGSDGRQRVNTKLFDQYQILGAPQTVFDAFDRVVKPMFQQVHAVFSESQLLKKARDALLPRLMSGELAV